LGRLFALIGLLLATLPAAAQADERILRFNSDVAIERSGDLTVTETIDVRSEGEQIRRGIYRDFPTDYADRHGGKVHVDFDLLGTVRDGRPERSSVERIGNGVRIRMGDPDVLLPPGEHRYVIRYRTSRQVGRFDRFDELYWNATGNGWSFPIDVAEASIRLPRPASFLQWSTYTGAQGSRDSNARAILSEPGLIRFQTTAPLGSYEGLTVAAAFPKGVLAEPSDAQRMGWWLADYGPPLAALLGLFAVLGYYFIAWKRAGRGPLAGTVVPIFAPPDDLTPAAMRYVSRMGSDNRAIAAALVDLGVRGKLRMEEEEGGWLKSDKSWLRRQPGAAFTDLPAPEAAFAAELFEDGDELLLAQSNYKTFQSAREALNSRLKKAYEDRLFVRNWRWSLGGLAVFAAAIALAAGAVLLAESEARGATVFVIAIGCFLGAWLIYRASLIGEGSGTTLKVVAGLAAVVGIALTAILLPLAIGTGRILPLLVPLLALPVVVSAFWWMAAPTAEGRRVLDRIAGFRQYLSIAERQRLDRMHPPEDTPELFERYLPFAVALGVENRWAKRFASVLAAASTEAQRRQGFSWYSGSHSPWSDTGAFSRSIGAALASSVSSSSASPGSGSGSGGGGSSGGGGGGGGGGGW